MTLIPGYSRQQSCRLAERAGWRIAGISVVLELSEPTASTSCPIDG
jgi:hypothetical protein